MKFDMKALMQQAQQMQAELAKKQEALAAKEFEAAAGGGMVTAVMNGRQELMKLTIDPSVIAAGDAEMLQDLVVAAVNECHQKVNAAMQEEMKGMMGGLGGLQNMFG